MPIKMSGISAIWLVRFLRVRRKDGAQFNHRQEHLFLETRQESQFLGFSGNG